MSSHYLHTLKGRELLPYLIMHIRQNSSRQNPFFLDIENWELFAKIHKETSVLNKLELLLKLAAQRTDPPGSWVSFSDNDLPLVDAMSTDELVYLLQQMQELGYIYFEQTNTSLKCIIQTKGWERLQEQTISGIPGRCFVAMSFDHSLDEAWNKGIFQALKEDCKLNPIRMDKESHNEKICDKIIAEIRQSQFVIADFTYHRGGVYFEAGFALGLGKPVIWTCRNDEFTDDKVHFDTRQYNHIVWTDPQDLREKLGDRLKATIPKMG